MFQANRSSSRREFLQRTVVVTSTLGLSIARSAHAAGDQSIKIGMIGCGGRCSGAAVQALSVGPDVKLAAMTDVFESRMRAKQNWEQMTAAKFEFEPKVEEVTLGMPAPTAPGDEGNYPLPIPGMTEIL